jgi:hypothetical protein
MIGKGIGFIVKLASVASVSTNHTWARGISTSIVINQTRIKQEFNFTVDQQ